MNLWSEMWERQKKQQEHFNLDPKAMSPIVKAGVAKDLTLGLLEEAGELSRAVARFKAHLLKDRPVDKINVCEASVDVLKYLIAIAQLYGVSSEEMFNTFMRKSDVVDDKARCERVELERHTKLIVSDLDGCIADLSSWQDEMDRQRGNAPMNDATLAMLEKLKEEFYRCGGFLNLPPIPGAIEATKKIREAGYKLAIITARPDWQYKRVYADTIQWLQKHDIQYDLILFQKDKAEAVVDHIFPARPLCFVEDRSKHAIEVASIGVQVLFLTSGKSELAPHPLIQRVQGWGEIVEYINATQDGRSEYGTPTFDGNS